MQNKVNYLPKGYHSITPMLVVNNAAKAMEFYKNVFGAVETARMGKTALGDKVFYGELKIGNSMIRIRDVLSDVEAESVKLGSTMVEFDLYVEDVDVVVNKAVAAGAKLLKNIEEMFYGDRRGFIEDPFGIKWFVATHIEDLSQEEIKNRAIKHGWIDLSR